MANSPIFTMVLVPNIHDGFEGGDFSLNLDEDLHSQSNQGTHVNPKNPHTMRRIESLKHWVNCKVVPFQNNSWSQNESWQNVELTILTTTTLETSCFVERQIRIEFKSYKETMRRPDYIRLFHNVVKFAVILGKTIVDFGQTLIGKHYHLTSLRLSCITWRKSVRIKTRRKANKSADFPRWALAEKRVSNNNKMEIFNRSRETK